MFYYNCILLKNWLVWFLNLCAFSVHGNYFITFYLVAICLWSLKSFFFFTKAYANSININLTFLRTCHLSFTRYYKYFTLLSSLIFLFVVDMLIIAFTNKQSLSIILTAASANLEEQERWKMMCSCHWVMPYGAKYVVCTLQWMSISDPK